MVMACKLALYPNTLHMRTPRSWHDGTHAVSWAVCGLRGHSRTVENGASSLSMTRELGTSKTCAESHGKQWLGLTIAGNSPED